ncbi:MAG TPA: hypothetical protein VMJ14_11795 [Burkholderiales bacterium]|nr:hypothetical protein [Burkholderiales bacterium]
MNLRTAIAALSLSLATASCYSWTQPTPEPDKDVSDMKRLVQVREQENFVSVAPMDPSRKVDEVNCAEAFVPDGGNLKCR